MQTFLEFMNFRSSEQPIRDWIFITDKSLEEAQEFLSGEELFRDLVIGENATENGKVVVQFHGDPMITIFELEELGITRAL